jgi:colanic acid/amylovoran biosynthesis glycosyltransferase
MAIVVNEGGYTKPKSLIDTMKNNLLVYNEKFFSLSETFIYNYTVSAAKEYNIHLLSGERINRDIFPIPSGVTDHLIDEYKNIADKIRTNFHRTHKGYSGKFSLYHDSFIQSVIRNTPINLIHAHYGPNGISILPYAQQQNVPLIVNFHGYDASRSTMNNEYMDNLKHLFDYASAIIIVSPHMAENLRLDSYADKVHIIPYGIDADYFQPESDIEKDSIELLHFGRLVEKKGVPDLVRVFGEIEKKYKNILLHVVGDGNKMRECKQVVEELQIAPQKVLFHGAQPHSVIKNLLERTDIFVLNSRTADDGNMEGLPNSILEAMSMEKAVVSTSHAGIPLAIKDGRNGLLVPEKDNSALFTAIEKLINDSELRNRLGKRARQTVLEKFTVRSMQSKVNEVYRAVLSEKLAPVV